jgi:putative DNA primase/helicase
MEDIVPDPEIRCFVWKAAGYSLTGFMHEQHFMLLYGKGNNGKSTFLEVLSCVMGDYAGRAGAGLLYRVDRLKCAPPSHEIADIFGKPIIIVSETMDGKLDEGFITT